MEIPRGLPLARTGPAAGPRLGGEAWVQRERAQNDSDSVRGSRGRRGPPSDGGQAQPLVFENAKRHGWR